MRVQNYKNTTVISAYTNTSSVVDRAASVLKSTHVEMNTNKPFSVGE